MLGYRFWDFSVDDNKDPILKSVTASYDWTANVVGNEIEYLAQIDQKKISFFDLKKNEWIEWDNLTDNPDDEFRVEEIGFMAFKDLFDCMTESYWDDLPMVSGAVNGFGKIAVHSLGWRAEYCQILGILDHIPCIRHEKEKGNIHMFESGYNLALCNDESHRDALNLVHPKVSFNHDFFLKCLSKRYEAPIMSFEQLANLGE